MDLKQIRYFVTVVEEGSINQAARKLHMTQPPVSKQMQLLEDELGCPLFLRSRQFDLALVRTPFLNRPFRCQVLPPRPMLAIWAPRWFHLPRGRDTVALEALAQVPLVLYRRWERIVEEAFQRLLTHREDLFAALYHGVYKEDDGRFLNAISRDSHDPASVRYRHKAVAACIQTVVEKE